MELYRLDGVERPLPPHVLIGRRLLLHAEAEAAGLPQERHFVRGATGPDPYVPAGIVSVPDRHCHWSAAGFGDTYHRHVDIGEEGFPFGYSHRERHICTLELRNGPPPENAQRHIAYSKVATLSSHRCCLRCCLPSTVFWPSRTKRAPASRLVSSRAPGRRTCPP